MTLRLYYDEPTLCRFRAQVVEQGLYEDSNGALRPAVRLDRTAFYPTSGGQPHDTGILGGVPVVEVLEDESREVWHLLANPIPPEWGSTGEVKAAVDWVRRFDHMQQHSGQHLLSAAFATELDARTIGFHLGTEAVTIDLDLADLDWPTVFRVEETANRVIWENRPVTARWVDEQQLEDITLRKTPDIDGPLRIVIIEGYDASACGGTHVAATGEIGLVKVTGIERHKGGVRVTFLCGGRALRYTQHALELLRTASLALSVGPDELPDAIERLQDQLRDVGRELKHLRDAALDREAEELWRNRTNPTTVIHHWPDRSFDDARALAARLRQRPGTVALLAVTEPNGVRVVCARSTDLDNIDARTLLRRALTPLGGRGGGSGELAQGGAPPRPSDEVRAALEGALREESPR